MNSICGADCENCGFGKNSGCNGCESTCGCPFGKQCFIAKYIKTGGRDCFEIFKAKLISEFNSLNIDGMPKISELYALNGAFVNLEYPMPNGCYQKLLDDKDIYLGTQVECLFNNSTDIKCFGLVAGMDFLLVSEYGKNCTDPQLILFKKR